MFPLINLNTFSVKIDALQTGAAIVAGQNFLPAWSPVHKTTSATGTQYGDVSCIAGTNGVIDDRDLVDIPQSEVI